MVRTHARTLAMKTFGIPARGRALLSLTVQLNHVCLTIASQRKFDDAVKPHCRDFPSLILAIPFGLGTPVIAQPFLVPFGKRNSDQNRLGLGTFKYRWNLTLPPDRFQM